MAVPAAFNGQSGSVTILGHTLEVTNWEATVSVDVLETTTTGSLGWFNNINGIKKAEGSFEMPMDSSNIPTGAYGIVNGATGTFIGFLGNTPGQLTGPIRISEIMMKNPAKEVVTFSVKFVSTGVFTLPT